MFMFNIGDKFINTSNLQEMEIISINEQNKTCQVKSLKNDSTKIIDIKDMNIAIGDNVITKIN